MDEKKYNIEEEDDNLSLKEIIAQVRIYWDYLWRKKWIIIACGLIGGILGVTYSIVRKTNYTANYMFSIESSSSGSMGGISSITSMLGLGGSATGAFYGDNLVELLKSRSLVEKTLLSPIQQENGQKETFIEYFIAINEFRKNCDETEKNEDKVTICDIYFPLNQARETFSRAQDSILMNISNGFLRNNISVAKKEKKLSFVNFSFTSANEDFAKHFSKALLNEVSAFYIDTKTSLSRKNIAAFQSQADSVRKELDNALSSRAYYADENINAAKQVVGVQLQKKQTDIQIYGTAYAEMIKNIEMLKLDLARETPLINVIDEPVLPLWNDKMGKKKGLIVGGFLGGFLSCVVLLGFFYVYNFWQKMKEEEEY